METNPAALHPAGLYLTLRIARHAFALPAAAVRGLLPARQMEHIAAPNPALLRYFGPFTCGFASIRGTEFPVMDLRARLGLAHGSHGRQPCVVAVELSSGAGPRLVGFVADRVSGVVRATEADFSHGKLRLAGRLCDVLLLDFLLDPPPHSPALSEIA